MKIGFSLACFSGRAYVASWPDDIFEDDDDEDLDLFEDEHGFYCNPREFPCACECHGSYCADCGNDTTPIGHPTEYYVVHDHVWAAADMTTGFLCIGCLERRLGRRVDRRDFIHAPVNDPVGPWSTRRTRRLRDRLRTVGEQLTLTLERTA